MAKLNIAERRLPQDGRIRLIVGSREIDLRVSTIPVLYGESIVMRILDRESIVIDLDVLGFSPQTLATFSQLINKPYGILLVTGPTGSGKTTTLYGALNKINSPDKKIITVEDPVEYQIKGINQIQVKAQIGLNFANTLRHIVRQAEARGVARENLILDCVTLAASAERDYRASGTGPYDVTIDRAPDQQRPRPNPRWIDITAS